MRIGELNSLGMVNRLQTTNRAIARSLERLSAGRRVNSAQDDPVAYAVSVDLDSQVRGLRQATLGINSFKFALENADSTLGTQFEIIQRMREIALQASNGTLSSTDRAQLNEELGQLLEEFERLASEVRFNDIHLLDGSSDTLSLQLSGLAGDSLDVELVSSRGREIFREIVGNGTFKTAQATVVGTPLSLRPTLGDFDGDGNLDLVQFSNSDIGVYLGNGEGDFSDEIYSASNVFMPYETAVSFDINGDNLDDLIAVSSDQGLAVFLSEGDGTFGSAQTFNTFAGAIVGSFIDSADMNGDGRQDVVFRSGSFLTIMTNDGSGAFSFATTLASNSSGIVELADFDGDGRIDVVTGDSGSTRLHRNLGNGGFSVSTLSTITDVLDYSSGDVDGDGDIDLVGIDNVVGDYARIFINNGAGSFSLSSTAYLGTQTGDYEGISLIDLNDDRALDIVSNARGAAEISVLLGRGNGSFEPVKTYSSGDEFGDTRLVAAGDFNNDGAADLAVALRSQQNFGILIQNTEDTLSLDEVSVLTQAHAKELLNLLDSAGQNLLDRRSELAAVHNRLDFTLAHNLLMSENLEEARVKSVDVDIVEETAELVRQQILQQAQIATLAQANLSMQIILKLLE